MRASNGWLRQLLPPHDAPCVSIFMPMERAKPPAWDMNPRPFRDLVDHASAEIARGYRQKDARRMADRIYSIVIDDGFWVGPRDEIAVFASEDLRRCLDLRQRVQPLVSVADTFHVKPLIRMLEVDQRYYVLGLTMRGVRIFAGDRDGLTSLDASGIPQNRETVSKMRLHHRVDAVTDHNTLDTQYPGQGTAPSAVPADRFVAAVDKAVWEWFSRDVKLPLILVADERPNAPFRSVSRNPYLATEGATLDPKDIDATRLHRETWKLVEPRFRREVEQLVDQFRAARAHGRGPSGLKPVADAAAVGRVDADRGGRIPGRLDCVESGAAFTPAALEDPAADDVLDDLAEWALKADGSVLALPSEQIPTMTGLAAIYRY